MIDFKCPNCGQGTIRPRRVPGRKASALSGLTVELPEALELPTCDHCHDYSIPEELENVVSDAVQDAQKVWQKRVVTQWVDSLCESRKISRQKLARALDVTPAYLSHVAGGTRVASPMLLRLLKSFVQFPAGLDDVLRDEPLESTRSATTAIDSVIAAARLAEATFATMRRRDDWTSLVSNVAYAPVCAAAARRLSEAASRVVYHVPLPVLEARRAEYDEPKFTQPASAASAEPGAASGDSVAA